MVAEHSNIEVDVELVERVMRVYRIRTQREAIELALRRALSGAEDPYERALALEGAGWDGDLESMRGSDLP
jgi:Arc/MetJ family transcription regulator